MRAQLRKLSAQCGELWTSRSPRERLVFASLAAVLGAALCLWLILSVDRARVQLRATVTSLRVQAARLEQQAGELEQLRAAPAVAMPQTDLRALVQAQVGAAGLSRALVSMEAVDANQVKVVLGAVAFADWLRWVASLQAQHIRLDACRIEALSTPGLVSVTATLVRAKPR